MTVLILAVFQIQVFIYFPWTSKGFTLSNPEIPVAFDSNCFIHIIAPEQNYSTTDMEDYLIATHSDQNSLISSQPQFIHTWTIHHDLNLLNSSISATELLEDDTTTFTVSERYFRFFFKRQTEQCNVVIILSESFNATLFAINGIGYGTSSHVLYLVGVSELNQNSSEILQGFSQDLRDELSEEMEIAPFHASLAFFVTGKDQRNDDLEWENNAGESSNASILVYCYFCPLEEIGKFHPINGELLENEIPTVSQVKDYWSQWNSQGYGNKIVLHSPGDWEYKDTTRINCTRLDRRQYELINRCHYAEMLVYNNLDNVLNMTYGIYRDIFRDKGMNNVDDWYLNINTDEWSMGTVVVNVYAATRGSYQIFQEIGYKFIYCNPRSKITYLAWDIFLYVFDRGTWLTFFGVIAVHALITRKLFYSLDLIVWPFLGMSTWRNHPRFLLGLFMILIGFFLQTSYSSGTSTDFIQMMSPMSASELFAKDYKTHVPGVSSSSNYVKMIYDAAPEFLRKRLHELIGKQNFGDILYIPPEKNYSMPRRPLEMIRDLVKRHLVVVSAGLPRYNSLMQVFATVNWAIIEDDREKYLCAGVGVPSHITIPNRRHASRTWGFLADKAATIMGHWVEMGFVKKFQRLLDYKLVLNRPIAWIDAGKISEQMPVSVNSPLGIACLGLVIVHLGNLLCFFSYVVYLRRREIWFYLANWFRPQYIQTNWLA